MVFPFSLETQFVCGGRVKGIAAKVNDLALLTTESG